MIYRKLGKTGLEVSAIGLGCEYVWFADEEKVTELVHAAVDAGVNYIDIFVGTPSTREYFGKALEGRRHKVHLAGHLGCADKEGQYIKPETKNCARSLSLSSMKSFGRITLMFFSCTTATPRRIWTRL